VLGFVGRRMVAKVSVVVALVVGGALVVQSLHDTGREADRMRRQTAAEAEGVAQLVSGAVAHAMMQGEGIEVERLIADLQRRTPAATIQVLDPRGLEVFAAEPPLPDPASVPRPVRDALATGGRSTDGDSIVRSLPSEPRCAACHPDGAAQRGVLVLDVDRAACGQARDATVTRLVTQGFTQVMTARRSDQLDAYFAELGHAAPAIRAVAVLDAAGDLAFGQAPDGFDGAAAVASAERGAMTDRGGPVALVPLVMDERCVACHDDPAGTVRGVLALWLEPAAGGMCDGGELEALIDTSLRYIMLSRLGRRIADFLDAAADTAAVRRLELYDSVGRRYWTTDHPPASPEVADVLRRGVRHSELSGSGEGERALVLDPMPNEPRCRRCHGGGDALRGVVSVSLSTAAAAAMREAVIRERVAFTVGLVVVLLALIVALLQLTVLRPVQRIGDVADRVGAGDLSARVARADPTGDEVARLGVRINQMVDGLRTKLQLERFVSKGTAAAASAAGLRGVAREGERRAAAVLFSDIRGFTAFSETVEPERVVEMLNRVLDAQAAVVEEHGGDIDKFVGDALMAVFQGDDAARRAAACAVGLAGAVAAARLPGEELRVGVGVAVGEVVYGAIGSEARLDFTVIGDVVNTAARLCSAAGADEVLVTDEVRAACGAGGGLGFDRREPMAVKGKRAPLVVWTARGDRPGGGG
jgi:class 3 adenylate cyclase